MDIEPRSEGLIVSTEAEKPATDVRALAEEMARLIGNQVALNLAQVEKALTEKTESARREIMGEIAELKKEQFSMSKSIVKIETRLDEGDKRFEHIEQRLTAMEERERASAFRIAKILGLLGLGYAGAKASGHL
jgi:septal ring factor EnvC (AmiA/AmiB activator)